MTFRPAFGRTARVAAIALIVGCEPPVQPANAHLVAATGPLDVLGADALHLAATREAAYEVVTGAEFAAALGNFPALATHLNGPMMKGSDVLTTYLHATDHLDVLNEGTVPLRTSYRKGDWTCMSQTAGTRLRAVMAGPAAADLFAVTSISGCTFDRAAAAAGTPEMACAVNTLAHEWTHSIVGDRDHAQVYTDDNHYASPADLVSYTVGAVAQCVYLNHWYRVYDPANPRTVETCVRRVKANAFDPGTCHAPWLAAQHFERR